MKQFALILLMFPFAACAQSKVESNAYQIMLNTLLSHTVKEISVSDPTIHSQTFTFLDAREKAEFEVSHIKNAIWVGYDDFDLKRVQNIDRKMPIIVYCSVGYRSEKVAEKLTKAGFTNVHNLFGGIFEWKNQDNSVVNLKGIMTENIHAYNKTWGVWLQKGHKLYP
jgi:rhodanese-related sulfurtransferase